MKKPTLILILICSLCLTSKSTFGQISEGGIPISFSLDIDIHKEKTGFTYDEKTDCYTCTQGVKLPFKSLKKEKNRTSLTKRYRATAADCRSCPLKEECCKKADYKEVFHSFDKPYYDKAYQLLNTRKGKQKMRLRSKTVEPVWGTLLHFRGMKKVYTKGNDLAHKQLLMAAAAYNLKKLLGFKIIKTLKSAAIVAKNIAIDVKTVFFAPFLHSSRQTLQQISTNFVYTVKYVIHDNQKKLFTENKWGLCNGHVSSVPM